MYIYIITFLVFTKDIKILIIYNLPKSKFNNHREGSANY